MDLDALSVRGVDEGLERVESGRDRLVHREARPQAEAVAPPDHLSDDRVRVDGLGGRDERVDLPLVVDAFTEGVRPERAELAGGRRRPVRRDLRGKDGEQASHVPEDSRERGELQSFSLPSCV